MEDVMRPAMEYTEAAMLTAQLRTVSGGAALRSVQEASQIRTNAVCRVEEGKAAPANIQRQEAMCSLRRAAFHQIRRF